MCGVVPFGSVRRRSPERKRSVRELLVEDEGALAEVVVAWGE
jgi:hypothetical protein